jgi:hypothetical protein
MKYLVSFLLLVVFAGCVNAQIPNAGFENWINQGNYLNPQGWWSANDSINTGDLYPVSRSDDHYPSGVGQYSLRLQNNLALQPAWTAWGLTWTGDFSGNDNPAFGLIGHPNALFGYYKFLPENGDTFEIHIRLYQNGEDVGGGQFKTADAKIDWTPFEVDFSDYAAADSARIMMLACYSNDAPMPLGNSTAFIDNLSFDSLLINSTYVLETEHKINIWPNPADQFIRFDLSNLNVIRDVSIYSIEGKSCLVQNTKSLKGCIDVSSLPEGIYCVVFSGGNTRHTYRFIKR